MGTLLSKDYDGDPYIDLMRSLPERELIWWVQKVIWMAEGYTFLEHFGRTYHTLFQDKCHHCNGAGIVTCPHCNGYKVKMVRPKTFRLSSMTTLANVHNISVQQECEHCGGYCEWDKHQEWENKWMKWEKTLSYYDRSYGKLLDEWYEDVVNEGNLEMDTPHEELDPPGADDTDSWADTQREVAGMPKRMEAMMKRFGHPYEHGDIIPPEAADPEKPALEAIRALGYNGRELPPELNPQAFPELLLMGPDNPIRQLDMEIRKEAMIMSNLEAAVRDQPKPYLFEPTAGTVPCPNCLGRPWFYRMTPNIEKLTFQDNPLWHRTLSRISGLAGQPQAGGDGVMVASSSGRMYGEYPQVSSLTPSSLDFSLDGESWSWPSGEGVRQLHYQRYMAAKQRMRDRQPYWMQEFGTRLGVSDDEGEREVAGGLWGSSDPLSESPERALDRDLLLQAEYNRDPVTGYAPGLDAAWAASQTPAKRVARRVRDLRLLEGAHSPEEEKAVWRYLQQRRSFQDDLGEPLEAQLHESDALEGVRGAR